MTQTSNGRTQRKSLANEIDRLDGILDGLDEALAGSVETAVRDVVGQVVRETVEATVREVLSNPDLIRSAIAQHAPVATPTPQQPRRTLKERLKEKLAALCRKAAEKASQAKRGLGITWTWCVEKVKRGCRWLWQAGKLATSLAHTAVCAACKFRKATLIALAVGALVGVGAYLCGPLIASSVCGLGGAAATAAGMALSSLWKMIGGGGNG
jgi:hypothetical protein